MGLDVGDFNLELLWLEISPEKRENLRLISGVFLGLTIRY